MKRLFTLLAVLTFLVGSVASAQRCFGDGPQGMRGGPGFCDITKCRTELDLTDKQVDQIKEINFNHRNAMIDLKAELQKAKLKMRQMQDGTSDKAAALAAAKEINGIEGRIAEANINHKFDIRSILNEEQIEKWKKCQKMCGHKCTPGCGHGGFGIGCDPAKCNKKGHPEKCKGHGGAPGF